MAFEKENGIIAICILATLQAKIESSPKAIATIIHEFKERGIDVGQITINRVPNGYDSSSIRVAIGSYFMAGLLSYESPILITPQGLKNFKEMVNEFLLNDPKTLRQIAEMIGVDLQKIISPK
ncbi:MAG: hypothetical protein WA063_02185 [Minisyncoccia bacterium]